MEKKHRKRKSSRTRDRVVLKEKKVGTKVCERAPEMLFKEEKKSRDIRRNREM